MRTPFFESTMGGRFLVVAVPGGVSDWRADISASAVPSLGGVQGWVNVAG
jgi:hypothetical protein